MALPSPTTPWVLTAAFGLAVGLRHAFEPDHLMAVATLVARQPDARTAARMGASWGVGHTVALLLLGSILAAARGALPAPVAECFELAVAVMIAGMGAWLVHRTWRMARTGAVEAHAHASGHHAHVSGSRHVHLGPLTLSTGPLAVGLVHGVAGSGALTAMTLFSLPTLAEQIGFMLVFGIGSTVGMAAAAGLAGWPVSRLARSGRLSATVSVATGVIAIVFGVTWGAPLLTGLLAR